MKDVEISNVQLMREALKAARQIAKEADLSEGTTLKMQMFTADLMMKMFENIEKNAEDSDDDIESLINRMIEALIEEDD